MTLSYGFYNSLNGDRTYDAIQLSSIFDGVITDGVFITYGSAFMVRNGTGMQVIVGSGRAWFNHTWSLNDADVTLTVTAADVTLNRIDSVILEVDARSQTRANSLKVLKGTAAGSPTPPSLTRSGSIYQYRLADIYVGSGVTSIAADKITNKVGSADCPIVSAILETTDMSEFLAEKEAEFTVWFNNLTNQLSGSQVTNLQNQINAQVAKDNGWIPLTEAWTYVSADGSTGVVTIPADLTTKLQKGARLKYSQAQALTAYWDMNSTANSQVGSFNGTSTNITHSAGKFSNAATFNGTTSKIVFTDNASLKPTEFSIGFWLKSSNTAAYQTIFQSWSQNTAYAGITLQTVQTTGRFRIIVGKNTGTVNNADYVVMDSTTNVCDNAFHYVVVTLRNNYLQIYIDGVLEASGYSFTPAYGGTNYVRMGVANSSGSDNANWFNGQIDDFYLINGYALDEQTIRAKFAANSAQGSSNITVVKNAIITNVDPYSGGVTTVTFWGGTDFALANASITSPHYSPAKVPFGFNPNQDKWSVFVQSRVNVDQASPVGGTYYNLGGSIVIPIGEWHVENQALIWGVVGAGTVISLMAGLSNLSSSGYLTEPNSISYLTGYTTTNLGFTGFGSSFIRLMAKTTYWFNFYTGGSITTLRSTGATVPASIRATLAYL